MSWTLFSRCWRRHLRLRRRRCTAWGRRSRTKSIKEKISCAASPTESSRQRQLVDVGDDGLKISRARGSLAACTSGRFCLPKRVDSWWQPVPSVEGSRGRSESPKSGRKPVVKNRSFFSEGSGWVPPAPGPCRVFVEKIDQGARKIENQVFRSKLGRNLPYFRQKIGQFSSKLPLQNSKSGENRGFCPLESIFRP